VLPDSLCQRLRQRPRLDARAPRLGLDLDPLHALGLEQQRVLAPVNRACVVAARVEGNPQALLGGEPDSGQHVFRRLGEDDPDRALDGGQVPGLPGSVPALVTRQDDVSSNARPEPTEIRHLDNPFLSRFCGTRLPPRSAEMQLSAAAVRLGGTR